MTDLDLTINSTSAPIELGTITVGSPGDMRKSVYDADGNGVVDNAEKVNDHTVEKDVPSDAVFTDTVTTINSKTGAIAKADIVALGIPAEDTNTTYSNATTEADGLMSSEDKTKLDGVDEGADNTTIINDLTTGGTTDALSAEQGKTLKGLVDDIEDDLTLSVHNLVSNGDFSDDTIWAPSQGSEAVSNNTYILTGDGSGNQPGLYQITNGIYTPGHKLYIKAKVRVTNADCTSFRTAIYGSGTVGSVIYGSPTSSPNINQWYAISDILTTPSNGTGYIRLWVWSYYADSATANGKVMQVQYVSCIDLTALYGAGNEPTADEFDAVMALYDNSWFDGTQTIDKVDDVIQRLQTKADTIQEDWIEPTLLNSWAAFDAGAYSKIRYFKDEFNFVHLDGLAAVGTANTVAFIMPVGYRPASGDVAYVTSRTSTRTITDGYVASTGNFIPTTVAYTNYVVLTGMSYLAEA